MQGLVHRCETSSCFAACSVPDPEALSLDPALTLVRRAALLDALQKVGMRHRPMRQRWALALLRATTGANLTRLKAFIDDGGCARGPGFDAVSLVAAPQGVGT